MKRELVNELLSLIHFGSLGSRCFAGLLIKLHNYFTACYQEQSRSVTQAVQDAVLINSRYVVTVCVICITIKTAAEEIKV